MGNQFPQQQQQVRYPVGTRLFFCSSSPLVLDRKSEAISLFREVSEYIFSEKVNWFQEVCGLSSRRVVICYVVCYLYLSTAVLVLQIVFGLSPGVQNMPHLMLQVAL